MTQKNALLSVYHKDRLIEYANKLIDCDYQLYASGGTAKKIAEKVCR